ncbi:MAG TPA: ABC transporter permease [Ruminococcus sp.]|nr:ABC transporter permease [Ruminococcus sp.]
MQVFKAFFKISKKKLGIIITYVAIFAAISMLITSDASKDDDFSSTKLDITIIDEDGSEESEMLVNYLSTKHDIVDIENNKEALTDALYYYETSYILKIKSGYAEKLKNNISDELFESYQHSESYRSTYFETQLNQYINTILMYEKGGFSLDDACKKAEAAVNESVEVKKEDFSGNNTFGSMAGIFFQYLPYMFISMFITCLCPIHVKFNRDDIKNRMNASSLSVKSKTLQILFASSFFVLAIWIIFMLIYIGYSSVISGKLHIIFSKNEMIAVLNSIIMAIIAAGIALIVSSFSPKDEAVSMIGNIIGLGSSFLCGVFVDQQFLGSGVLSAARFIPVYWYVKANNTIFGRSGETYDITKVFEYIGVELLFAAFIFSILFLLTKLNQSDKKSL